MELNTREKQIEKNYNQEEVKHNHSVSYEFFFNSRNKNMTHVPHCVIQYVLRQTRKKFIKYIYLKKERNENKQ